MFASQLSQADPIERDPTPPPPQDVWQGAFDGAPPELRSPDQAKAPERELHLLVIGGATLRQPDGGENAYGGLLGLRLEYTGWVELETNAQTGGAPPWVGIIYEAQLDEQQFLNGNRQVALAGRLGVRYKMVKFEAGLGLNSDSPFMSAVLAVRGQRWELGADLRVELTAAELARSISCSSCAEEEPEDECHESCQEDTKTEAVGIGLYFAWVF